MTGSSRLPKVSVAIVVALALLAVGLVTFAPTAAAQNSETYVVEQGERCIEVDPISGGSQSVEEFYDYRNETYSSHGTKAYQQDDTSQLLVYEGPQGTSLVVVHDRLHDDEADGTNGSSATFTFSGLPDGSDWAIRDDNYGGQDDSYDFSGSTRTAQWRWDRARTDGAAYRLGTGDFSVGIDATFNENRWSGTYHGRIDSWKVVTETGDGIERETLETDEPVTVSPGTCGGEEPDAPTAQLDAPESAATDETVTLDASDSETGSDPTYEWYVDGQQVEGASGPTHETSFSESGTHEVRVTVTDDGGSDSAERTIEVTEGPTARFEPDSSSAEAGREITFNASESTGDISSYEWSFGDGTGASGEEVAHAYEHSGTYEVELTVTDENGASDTATRTVEVTQPGPTAELVAPETAEAGETVTLDASGSETGDDPSYTWYVDREEVSGADGPTLDVTFDEPGTHDVRVEVTDGGGTDVAEAEIEVEGDLEALADADPTTVEPGETVTFDGGGSAGDVAEYRWDFGDGTTATGENPAYAFEDPGQYLVELVVEGEHGDTDSDTVTVTVDDPGGGGTPGGDGDPGDPGDPSGDGTTVSGEGPMLADSNGTTVVSVGEVRAGEPVSVDLSPNGSAGAPIAVSSVEVVPAEDADDLTVRFQANERDVPGRFTATNGIGVLSTADLESVTYEFALDTEALADTGVDGDDVTTYALDDEWSALETETRTEGDRLVAAATVDGGDPVAVGTDGPALYVTDVRSDGAVTDGRLPLEVTVRNTGTKAGEQTVGITGGGDRTELPVSLGPNEETVLKTNVTVDDPGALDVRAGATRGDVLVVTATDVSVDETTIEAGETVTVEVELRNHADAAGEFEAGLVLADNVVDTERVEFEPGGTATVTFEQRIESPGTYELSVGDETVAVTVEGDDDGDGGIGGATEDGAGPGALAALLAAFLALLCAHRRGR